MMDFLLTLSAIFRRAEQVHAIGQTQHPLPHGHVGEHVIDQMGGALGHPAAAATRTKRAAFTGKRDQPVEAAVAATKPREPAREPAALKKVSELLLDEAGQAFAVAQVRGLRAKRLEVIVHDLIERTLRGIPRSAFTQQIGEILGGHR